MYYDKQINCLLWNAARLANSKAIKACSTIKILSDSSTTLKLKVLMSNSFRT